jgi:Flp pilus assembly protein TadD
VLLVIGLVAVIGIVAAAVIGYLVFFNNAEPRQRRTGLNNTNAETNNNSENNNATTRTVSDPEAAAAHYRAGLGHQEDAVRFAQAGSTQRAVGAHSQAIAEYRLAIAAKQDYPDAHENLGVSLYYTGESDAAAEEYRTAIDQRTASNQKPSAQLFTNYGLALFDAGRYREAASAFGRALELDSSDYDLYVHRGFALDNAGDKDSAKVDYDRYLQLAPSGEYAANVRRVLQGREKPPSTSGGALVTPGKNG